MRTLGVALLVVGYPVAVGVLARLRPVLRERRRPWFLALEAAMLLICAGWALIGRAIGPIVNGAAFVAFAVAWVTTGRRTGRTTRAGTGPGS